MPFTCDQNMCVYLDLYSWTNWTDSFPCPEIRLCGRVYNKTQIRTCTNSAQGENRNNCEGESLRIVTCPYLGACQGMNI